MSDTIKIKQKNLWALVDDNGEIHGVTGTREEAREVKNMVKDGLIPELSEEGIVKVSIAKMTFDGFVR